MEIIVFQYYVWSFLGNFSSSFPHWYANFGSSQCRSIICTIASHSNNFTILLKCLYNPQLLIMGYSCKDRCFLNGFRKLIIWHSPDLISGKGWFRVFYANHFSNSFCCYRIVSREHYYPNSRILAELYGVLYSFPWRVYEANHAYEYHITIDKISLFSLTIYSFIGESYGPLTNFCHLIYSIPYNF